MICSSPLHKYCFVLKEGGYPFERGENNFKIIYHADNDEVKKILIFRKKGAICFSLFLGLLIFLPILREVTSLNWIAMFDSFYRAGSLVLGVWQGGVLATVAIFLPAFLLILGTLPFGDQLRHNPKIKGALMGVNAAVVSIFSSVFYYPIWTSAILQPVDFAAILFSMLVYWKLPPGSL